MEDSSEPQGAGQPLHHTNAPACLPGPAASEGSADLAAGADQGSCLSAKPDHTGIAEPKTNPLFGEPGKSHTFASLQASHDLASRAILQILFDFLCPIVMNLLNMRSGSTAGLNASRSLCSLSANCLQWMGVIHAFLTMKHHQRLQMQA